MIKTLLALLLISQAALADTPPPATTDHLREGTVNLYSTTPRIDARITLQKGAANGLATLDGAGKIPTGQLPTVGATWGAVTGTLSNQTDLQSALNAKYDASNPSSYVNAAGASSAAPVQSVAGKTGAVSLVKGDVGLGNVDNTSDASKPVSTATQTALNAKEPSITAGTSSQYWAGNKTFLTLNTAAVPELTNLYYTQARFDSAFSGKSTTNLPEGSNLYWTQGRFDSAFGFKSTTNLTEGSNLYFTTGRVDAEFDTRLATKSTSNLTEGTNLYFTDARAQNAVFSRLNYITNPDAEVNTAGWNLYNDSGRTAPAFVVDQDITYTSALSGGAGNGATVTYALGTSPYVEPPVITCPAGASVLVKWYNGPTVSQNPTATVLKAAWDATPCAVAIASAAITGNASTRQYQIGTATLAQGGDTAPVDGTGGSSSGVTFTRTTSSPLVGSASFDLGKSASPEQGQGVSTDFSINSADRGNQLQLSLFYSGLSAFIFGSSSDVQVFLYDVTNATMLPLTKKTFAGTTGNVFRFSAQFTASSTSTSYRLIFHIATTNASAWDLLLDSVTVNATLDAVAATKVPSVVLSAQPISGAVTDHMVVMWRDGATQWVPATIAGAAIGAFGDDFTQLGFATNIVGSAADVYVRGSMGGFSFGPFSGFEQYIDNTAGGISPLPSPFNDMYVAVGMAIASDTLNIQFTPHVSLISNSSGVPLKGGLLTNSGINDGTGDQVLIAGANGAVPFYNSAAALGIQTGAAVVVALPFTYMLATRTLTAATATNSVAGFLSAADHTTFAAAAPLASPAFTGTPSLPTGTTGVTQTAADSTTKLATTAFVTTADNLKANLASPAFSGTPSLPTGTTGVTQTAADSTTKLATTAFVTTADNLKANAASPTFTGDVNSSTGNVLVSTIGKGLQVKTGTNAKIGTAVLVGGTKTVANTSVTANSRIFLQDSANGGTPGILSYTKSAGVGFTINSANALDTSTIDWFIVESIP